EQARQWRGVVAEHDPEGDVGSEYICAMVQQQFHTLPIDVGVGHDPGFEYRSAFEPRALKHHIRAVLLEELRQAGLGIVGPATIAVGLRQQVGAHADRRGPHRRLTRPASPPLGPMKAMIRATNHPMTVIPRNKLIRAAPTAMRASRYTAMMVGRKYSAP